MIIIPGFSEELLPNSSINTGFSEELLPNSLINTVD
jgi:hypothetical protein